MRIVGLVIASAALVGGLASARPAKADCLSTRPTDPGGYAGFSYGADPALWHDTSEGRVRIWYAMTGPHAVTSELSAVRAGEVMEEAIVGYAAMGFIPAMSDAGYADCASNGGDGRLDVYLVRFAGADGNATQESCVTEGSVRRCAGFILAESRLEDHYVSFDEGARTVLPHELFHLIQNAYDADGASWWSEGTAQWATKRLYPDLDDLERFLPAYFGDATRSLDAPPGGPVAGFLYGTAIWPVFLGERHGDAIIRSIYEGLAESGASVLVGTDETLASVGADLASEFLTFATWNVATGDRAYAGGYRNASRYPLVSPTAIESEPGTALEGVTSGLGARYFFVHASSQRLVTLAADPTRLAAVVVPLEAGAARIDRATPLPAIVEGEAIIVLAGQSALKSDARFTLRFAEAPVEEPPVDETPDDEPPEPARDPAASPEPIVAGGGCSLAPRAPAGSADLTITLSTLAMFAAARRRRLAPSPQPTRAPHTPRSS